MRNGSLHNMIAANTRSAAPQVGMGATIVMWSDRHAATIVGVSDSGSTVSVQRDRATRTDNYGMSDSQSYAYSPNPEASIQAFTLRKTGRWVRRGEPEKGGTVLLIGQRDEYYDYSF
ncbi:hypothetical protein [Mycobacteroides abscessus]|uniref:hypothetical protein n=1 Tax=Mycobacteroides abscessus TaxID=36809 RepID=UPI0005DBE76E|nr:hypothetical protein [Mycobacteroides abscessus]CPW67078.1 Uncharacterised protein [Mycobacteroides abscessus]SKF61974.1 Uncharacterised protein [Mycobacteroides abscessus subsp. bolletii]SKH89826.1 Uncharacterised protein [Mycobacteroides abscessus subsp. bolletii]